MNSSDLRRVIESLGFENQSTDPTTGRYVLGDFQVIVSMSLISISQVIGRPLIAESFGFYKKSDNPLGWGELAHETFETHDVKLTEAAEVAKAIADPSLAPALAGIEWAIPVMEELLCG